MRPDSVRKSRKPMQEEEIEKAFWDDNSDYDRATILHEQFKLDKARARAKKKQTE